MKLNKLLLKKKSKIKPLVCLTASNTYTAEILDDFCDIILVGDSLGMVVYGEKTTKKVSLDMMINHGRAVRKGIKKSTFVVDMPFNTYKNLKIAKKNVKKVLKETRCDAVKLESNGKNFHIIKQLVKSNIPVMGHIGFTPQYKKKFRPQGMKDKDEKNLIKESKEIEKAGAFSLVLECVSEKTAKKITKTIKIPTIGIGSSKHCDGQILVTDDLIGLSGFYPKFVKKYLNLEKILENTIAKFKNDVRNNIFPKKNNNY